MPHSSEKLTRNKKIYDIGTGARIAALITLAATVGVLVWLLRRDPQEIPTMLRSANIAEGIVYLLGIGILISCIGFGFWSPLRVLAFPRRSEGIFSGHTIQKLPSGKQQIRIRLEGNGDLTASYNSILQEALVQLSIGDKVRILYGPKSLISRIYLV